MLTRPGASFFVASIGPVVGGGAGDALADNLSALSLTNRKSRTSLQVYSRTNAVAAMEMALQAPRPPGAVLDFTVCPGQEIFATKLMDNAANSSLPIHGGRILEVDMKSQKLKPYFNSFPLASIKPALIRRLGQLGYKRAQCSARPNSFTAVSLVAGPERQFASVKLTGDRAISSQRGGRFPNIISVKTNK